MNARTMAFSGIIVFACLLAGFASAATPTMETSALPPCREVADADHPHALRIGLATPGNPQLARHLAELAQTDAAVTLCRESWSTILPLATPFAKVAHLDKYYGWGVFLFGLATTLLLAASLTPRRWWRQPTALGLAGLFAATWLIGAASLACVNWLGWPQRLLYADILSLQRGHDAVAWKEVDGVRGFERMFAPFLAQGLGQPATMASASTTAASRQFSVRQALNMREHAGIDGKRLSTLGVGDIVTTTGLRLGDWWQVQTSVDGRRRMGWVSSLWLTSEATPGE